jgi:surface carbohydrate biosynthesis protein
MKKKTLYILMENQVRELNTYLLISIIASYKGYRIYLGTQYSIFKLLKLKKKRGGIFINKGSSIKGLSKLIKKKCDKYIIIDQEISPGYSDYFYNFSIPARHYEDTLLYVDRYYCINDKVKKIAEKTLLKENSKLKIKAVGWPRFDIMKGQFNCIFQSQILKFKKKYKNFILFNSDFGLVSKHDIEMFDTTKIFRSKDIKFVKKNNLIKKDIRNHVIKDFLKFKIFLSNIVSKIGNTKIVIRPHPAESLTEWKKIVKKSKKIFLEEPTYDATSIILAATHVIHRGCTTGYQSLVSGKKTGYLDLINENRKPYYFRPSLFNLSKKIKNENNFLQWLRNNRSSNSKIINTKLNKILNIKNKLSSERIIDDIETLNVKSENKHNAFELYNIFQVKYDSFKGFLHDILVKFRLKKDRNFSNKFKIPKIQKNFDKKNIEYLLKNFLKSSIFIKKKSKINVKKISDVLFEIEKN